MHDPAFEWLRFLGLEGGLGRGDLAGAARLELVSGVVQLRPEGRNPAAGEFGRFGMLNVRYGKAKKGSRRVGGMWPR